MVPYSGFGLVGLCLWLHAKTVFSFTVSPLIKAVPDANETMTNLAALREPSYRLEHFNHKLMECRYKFPQWVNGGL